MQNRFFKFITHQCNVNPDDSILAGVSGGLDSVVLLDLLVRYGFKVVVAHCNFSLRGAESDGDEQFVCRLAAEHHLPLEQITFGTEGVAKEKG
ncbi:MAG: ATP-binding protein, partial [Bacteroidota bacterium]|nr:ATP-binding protein [Bacteroidota bacterium]